MLNGLLALVEPGDEVLVTDPTYAGMIYRVRLAGGVPRFVPFVARKGRWTLDLQRFHDAVNDRTRAVSLMKPSIPSGAVMTRGDWEEIARVCEARGIWLLYNAAMERILFGGREYIHPASVVAPAGYRANGVRRDHGVGAVAGAGQGGGHADDPLGARERGPVRADRFQQRAGGAAGGVGGPGEGGAQAPSSLSHASIAH